MKHNVAITAVLIGMFLITQLIGLVVIDAYSPKNVTVIENGVQKNITISKPIPYGMEPPPMKPQASLVSVLIGILIATLLFFFLTKIKARFMILAWFTLVVYISLAIALNALLGKISLPLQYDVIALVIAVPLTFLKIFRRNLLAHNFTELLIYPGIASIFVPILSVWATIILLFAISIYDIYAVWHSKFMVKLAKYQIQKLKVFTGFFVPYLTKEARVALEKMKSMKKKGSNKFKVKISLAILGGGDVAFPLIFAGVLLRASGLLPALLVILGATIALLGLFVFAKKGKFYPAMPFISAGCIVGYLISLLL